MYCYISTWFTEKKYCWHEYPKWKSCVCFTRPAPPCLWLFPSLIRHHPTSSFEAAMTLHVITKYTVQFNAWLHPSRFSRPHYESRAHNTGESENIHVFYCFILATLWQQQLFFIQYRPELHIVIFFLFCTFYKCKFEESKDPLKPYSSLIQIYPKEHFHQIHDSSCVWSSWTKLELCC